jgi:hypothetical protein
VRHYGPSLSFACPPKVELYRRQARPPEFQHRRELSALCWLPIPHPAFRKERYFFSNVLNSAISNPKSAMEMATFLWMTPEIQFANTELPMPDPLALLRE